MLKPLNKNIVLKKEEVENKTASGIILTTETKSLPTVGEVVAVGPQCENDLKTIVYKDFELKNINKKDISFDFKNLK